MNVQEALRRAAGAESVTLPIEQFVALLVVASAATDAKAASKWILSSDSNLFSATVHGRTAKDVISNHDKALGKALDHLQEV